MEKVRRWIEKLSRIYQPDRKFLNGSRSYRDKFQKARWIEIVIRFVETRRRKASIEENLSRIYREAIELEEKKKVFSREEKHIKMNATSKLLKHRSNQHIKLSKQLSTYMQSIQDPKHTHTQQV